MLGPRCLHALSACHKLQCCLLSLLACASNFRVLTDVDFIAFVRTMTDLVLHPRIKDLAKEVSDLKKVTVLSVTRQSVLLKKATEEGSEIADVRATVASERPLSTRSATVGDYR